MTSQARDLLVIDGAKRSIECLPFESCPFKDEIFTRDERGVSTALARGYLATWSLRDDQLWLDYWDDDLHSLRSADETPALHNRKDLLADWFTGAMYVYAPGVEPDTEPKDGEPEGNALDLTFVAGKLLLCEELEPEEAGRVRSPQKSPWPDTVWVSQSRLTRYAQEWCGADEWPFVAALHENLDDLGLRLVYADWLEERGDPRAQLFRRLAPDVGLRARPQMIAGWLGIPLGAIPPTERTEIWRRLVGMPRREFSI